MLEQSRHIIYYPMNLNPNEDNTLLQCLICYKKVKKARMCPNCSKLGCNDCIFSWSLKQSQCPNCRTYLKFSDYTNCERFIQQIRQQLMIDEQTGNQKDICPQHHLKMRYYCDDCACGFCPDCGAFNNTHKGHKIKLIADIYGYQRQRIQKQLNRFDMRIEDYRTKSVMVKKELQKLAETKNQRKLFIETYILNMLTQLEFESQEKESLILSRYQTNEEDVELLENIKDTILNDLEEYSQNEVINKTDEFLHLIRSLCERNIQELEIDTNFSTIAQLVPDYQCFHYTLPNFSTLDQSIIYSSSYHFNGCQWRLKIYPKGNGIAKNKFISVFLEMTKGISNKIKYQYKIELNNHLNQLESMVREYSSEFEIGECWGYNQFIELKNLEFGYLAEDELSFKFYVRNPTYKDMAVEQKKYINLMANKIKELEKTVSTKNGGGSKEGRGIREIMEEMANKRGEVRKQINSIENEALDLSHHRMEEKEEVDN